jgi:NADPH:quinone reductase-like Zn-dependent oxidoreductase
VDNVGGDTLAGLCRKLQPYGNVASCGMAGGHEVHGTVMPHIIRGVSALGIASAGTAIGIRRELWRRLGSEWKPAHLDAICTREVGLAELPGVFPGMLAGGSFGRTLVNI